MGAWRYCFNLIVISVILPQCDFCMVYKSLPEDPIFDEADNELNRYRRDDARTKLNPPDQTGKDKLSEAKCKDPNGVAAESGLTKRDLSLPLIEPTDALQKRVEINSKCDTRVTLNQIENECEESMRKQFKENQHKKKLQFTFLGKRNEGDAVQSNSSNIEQNDLLKNRSNLIESSDQIDNKTLAVKRWIFDDGKLLNNKDFMNVDLLGAAIVKGKVNNSTSLLGNNDNENVQSGVVRKSNDFVKFEDEDDKLLKAMFNTLNNRHQGLTEIEPLINALKELADKRLELNALSQQANKPVSHKHDSCEQLSNVISLMKKMSDYKLKQYPKKITSNHIGSSPLNPTMINNEYCPIVMNSLDRSLGKPNETQNSSKMKSFLISKPIYQSHLNYKAVLPIQQPRFTKKYKNEREIFSSGHPGFNSLINKILNNVNIPTKTDHLQSIIKNMDENNRVAIENTINSDREGRNIRDKKHDDVCSNMSDIDSHSTRTEKRSRREIQKSISDDIDSILYHKQVADQYPSNSSCKHRNSTKYLAKVDELRRLQKVATELKTKIDELLNNLDPAYKGVTDEDDYDDEDDDEEDDDEDEEEEDTSKVPLLVQPSLSSILQITTASWRQSIEDSYDSFKKFKCLGSAALDRLNKKMELKKEGGRNIEKNKQSDLNKHLHNKLKRDKRGKLKHYSKQPAKFRHQVNENEMYTDVDPSYNDIHNENYELGCGDSPLNAGINDRFHDLDVYEDNNYTRNQEVPFNSNPKNSFDVFKLVDEYRKVSNNKNQWNPNGSMDYNYRKYMNSDNNNALQDDQLKISERVNPMNKYKYMYNSVNKDDRIVDSGNLNWDKTKEKSVSKKVRKYYHKPVKKTDADTFYNNKYKRHKNVRTNWSRNTFKNNRMVSDKHNELPAFQRNRRKLKSLFNYLKLKKNRTGSPIVMHKVHAILKNTSPKSQKLNILSEQKSQKQSGNSADSKNIIKSQEIHSTCCCICSTVSSNITHLNKNTEESNFIKLNSNLQQEKLNLINTTESCIKSTENNVISTALEKDVKNLDEKTENSTESNL